MALKKRRGQQAVAAEIRRPAAEFHSEIIPVEISLGCSDLPILQATGSCLSVFAVLWVRKQGSERWQEHGRTEVVRSGSAPQFMRSFFLDFLDHDDVLRNEEYLLRTTRVGCLCVCARACVCVRVTYTLAGAGTTRGCAWSSSSTLVRLSRTWKSRSAAAGWRRHCASCTGLPSSRCRWIYDFHAPV